MKRLIYLCVLLVLFAGCNEDESQNLIGDISFETVAQDLLFGAGKEGFEQTNLVIRKEADWNTFINQLNSVNNVSDQFTETDIDFSKYMIIAVISGVKSQGGLKEGVTINSVFQNSENVLVNYTENDGGLLTVVSQPFHIIKVANTNQEVVFKKD